MPFSESLAERIRTSLAPRRNIQEKKMFGGLAFLLNGNMLVGVWQTSLIARIGPEVYQTAILKPYVKEFNITGRSMTGWVLVDPEGVENDDQLKEWIEVAWRFVSSLPPK